MRWIYLYLFIMYLFILLFEPLLSFCCCLLLFNYIHRIVCACCNFFLYLCTKRAVVVAAAAAAANEPRMQRSQHTRVPFVRRLRSCRTSAGNAAPPSLPPPPTSRMRTLQPFVAYIWRIDGARVQHNWYISFERLIEGYRDEKQVDWLPFRAWNRVCRLFYIIY